MRFLKIALLSEVRVLTRVHGICRLHVLLFIIKNYYLRFCLVFVIV